MTWVRHILVGKPSYTIDTLVYVVIEAELHGELPQEGGDRQRLIQEQLGHGETWWLRSA